jgi:hypothetical protein
LACGLAGLHLTSGWPVARRDASRSQPPAGSSLATKVKSNKNTVWFPASRLDEAETYMIAQAEHDDVYFGWGLQESEPSFGRGTSETVSVLGGLMMDIDLKSSEAGVHSKNEHLPETLEEVAAFVRDIGVPEPTANTQQRKWPVLRLAVRRACCPRVS